MAKAAAAAASGNLVSAALYKAAAAQNFISAAKYGIASAATAVAGRFAAGDSQKDTASRAVNGSSGADAEPRNRTFNAGGNIEPSSQAARDGSGGILGGVMARIEAIEQRDNTRTALIVRALDRNSQALSTIENARPDDVIMKASPVTVARQSLQGAKENYDIVFETMQLQGAR